MGCCLSRCAGHRAQSYQRLALHESIDFYDESVSTTGPDATHCVRSNSVPSFQDILHHLDDVRDVWFSIGLVLGIKMTKLREIEQQNLQKPDGTRRCLAELIEYWLYSDPSACWARLIRALEQLDHLRLAAAIKRQHLWEPSESVYTSHNAYVPRFLATSAISKLHCANWRLPNCVPISKLRIRNFETAQRELLRKLEMTVYTALKLWLQAANTSLNLL